MKRPLVLPALVLVALSSVFTSAQAPVLGRRELVRAAPIPGEGRFKIPIRAKKWHIAPLGRFGARRGYGWHDGVDFAVPHRTPIFAARAGNVERLGHFDKLRDYGRGYGGFVVIRHADGSRSWYAHLETIYVAVGDAVSTKTRLGLSGGRNNGHSSGPHLHFGVIRPNGQALNPEIAFAGSGAKS
ncbi:MAG: M23 family metallopeptidase [Elusimicrobia bacterium]|nr:M23 family metallopeptidase [Elusimicrobiota bacterium]